MTHLVIAQLEGLTETIPAQLRAIGEHDLSQQPTPGKWSKKQIIGHIIDSATNNHHRLIRAQYEYAPYIGYDQDEWVTQNHWQEYTTTDLIDLWTLYNKHLVHVMKRIPQQNMQNVFRTADNRTETIAWLIQDYVAHLEHHLAQIIDS